MDRTGTEIGIVWKHSAADASIWQTKDESNERSLDKTVIEIGLLSVPLGDRSDVEL